MEFKRYTTRIVKIRKNERDLGFGMKLYFKDKEGRILTLQSKLIPNHTIKTKEIFTKNKSFLGFFFRRNIYSFDFIEEILTKVGNFREIRGINFNEKIQ